MHFTHRGVVSLQVHKMLAEFRLIPGLNNLFDKLIWRKFTASNHVVHGQNENCDCSPVRSPDIVMVFQLNARSAPDFSSQSTGNLFQNPVSAVTAEF